MRYFCDKILNIVCMSMTPKILKEINVTIFCLHILDDFGNHGNPAQGDGHFVPGSQGRLNWPSQLSSRLERNVPNIRKFGQIVTNYLSNRHHATLGFKYPQEIEGVQPTMGRPCKGHKPLSVAESSKASKDKKKEGNPEVWKER